MSEAKVMSRFVNWNDCLPGERVWVAWYLDSAEKRLAEYLDDRRFPVEELGTIHSLGIDQVGGKYFRIRLDRGPVVHIYDNPMTAGLELAAIIYSNPDDEPFEELSQDDGREKARKRLVDEGKLNPGIEDLYDALVAGAEG